MNLKNEIKELYDIKNAPLEEEAMFTIDNNTDDEKVRNLHNNISRTLKYFRNRKVNETIKLGGFLEGDKLLEIGSNMGQYSVLFSEKKYNVVGIDISNIIEVAKRNAELLCLTNVEYYQADVEDLSMFKDETFDGVISYSTMRYVPDLKKALEEIYRVVKKDGTIILDFPNKLSPWYHFLKKRFGVKNHIGDNLYSRKMLKKTFQEAGFRHNRFKYILFTHFSFTPRFLFVYKIIDIIGESIPCIKSMAAIIIGKGVK